MFNKITLFTTGCPNCEKLENLLRDNGFGFIIEKNVQEVIDKGFTQAPVLKVENEETNYYNYVSAVKLIRAGGLKNEN